MRANCQLAVAAILEVACKINAKFIFRYIIYCKTLIFFIAQNCMNRWELLKSYYRREKTRGRNWSLAKAAPRKGFANFESMTFLEKYKGAAK